MPRRQNLTPAEVTAAQRATLVAWAGALTATGQAVKASTGQDPREVEPLALAVIQRALDPLSIEGRERAVRYLAARYLSAAANDPEVCAASHCQPTGDDHTRCW